VSGPVAELAGAQVIALAGEIDPGMVIALHRRIDRALDAGASYVVLDLGAVTVLGGQTVSVLCGALRRLARRGATISIAGSPPHVQRVLKALCD
jgi:anti-anti-sigma factor